MWWVAFTFHTHEGRKHRVRRSLGTPDVEEARTRRDELLKRYEERPGWRLALRFVDRRWERQAPAWPWARHAPAWPRARRAPARPPTRAQKQASP